MATTSQWQHWVSSAAGPAADLEAALDPKADAEDIALSLRGDEEAYARLIRRYQALVARQLWKFTRDPGQLDELLQEVFVEVYTSLGGFRGEAPFLHWVRRITTRVGYRFWKHQARRRERETALDETRELEHPGDFREVTEAAELAHLLLAELPPRDRMVLTLLYLEELDTKEIAARLGWSRSLVKVQAYRARQKLKKLLDERDFGWPLEG